VRVRSSIIASSATTETGARENVTGLPLTALRDHGPGLYATA